MKKDHYLEQFGLTNEDSNLRILDCSHHPLSLDSSKAQKLSGRQNIQSVDPKQLPTLPFADQTFDLVLCANVLFVGSNLTENEHVNAILELARVGSELRIAPVTDEKGSPSSYLGPVIQALQLKGFGVELSQATRQEGNKGNAVLKIWQESCALKFNRIRN